MTPLKLGKFPVGNKPSPPPKKRKRKKAKRVRKSDLQVFKEDLQDMIDTHLTSSSLPSNLNELPDPVELLKKAVDENFDLSVFDKRGYPTAPNIVEWVRGRQYLNTNTPFFPRQLQVLVHFTKDACYFCSDLDYIFNVPVNDALGNVIDRFALLQHGICPICQRNRKEILHEWVVDPRFHKYHDYDDGVIVDPVLPNELCCLWGQRSGKSHSSSTYLSTYQLHRYIALPSPMAYYNEPANKVLEATFVAPVLKQVNNYVWSPLRQVLDGSPWFQEVKSSLRDEGRKLGVKLFQSAQTYMNFVSKRLSVHMQAANSVNLRGGTRFLVVMDELGWFNVSEDGKRRSGVRDGAEVFKSLHNSLFTIRNAADERWDNGDYDAINAVMANISSPSSIGDPIMQRVHASHKDPRIYYTHYATHEMNPRWTEKKIWKHNVGVPEWKVKRDWFAIPPKAANAFFNDSAILHGCVHPDSTTEQRLFDGTVKVEDDGFGQHILKLSINVNTIDRYTPRVVAVDNGESKNSFAICLASYSPEVESVYLEEFLEIAPYSGRTVDLAACYDGGIVPLVQGLNILYVGYDRWNSAQAYYDLRTKHRVQADRYSLKWKDFEAFRSDLMGNKLQIAKPEVSVDEVINMRDLSLRSQYPRAHFMAQVLTVNEFSRRLFKPDYGNDDLFRVGVLAWRFIKANEKEFQKKTRRLGRAQRKGNAAGYRRANKVGPGMFRLPKNWWGVDGAAALGNRGGGSRADSPGTANANPLSPTVGVSSVNKRR